MSTMRAYADAVSRVSVAAKSIAARHRTEIDALKNGAAELKRPDWLWFSLLLSLSTMGNSRGAKLVKDSKLYRTVSFDELAKLTPGQRRARLKESLRLATVRMPDIKAEWLMKNFTLIRNMGGPQQAKALLFSERGRDSKTKWLRRFKGIGAKYSRNMLMDVYDSDFHDSIAIDQRIKSISDALKLSFKKYEEHERFYLEIAREAGLQGWELDRLMYNFISEFIREITTQRKRATAGVV